MTEIYKPKKLSAQSWHLCLDLIDQQLPPYIHLMGNGQVVTQTKEVRPGSGFLFVRIGQWVEYYPDEGTNLQYAKVTIEEEWCDYWNGIVTNHLLP